ncbi:MAG: hypothetical protein QXX41_08940 [Nitrososphaerota archaeon]
MSLKISLPAIRFQYDGGESFENIEWYTVDLRRFLWRHKGKAVWLQGAKVTREAFIIYIPEEDVKRDLVNLLAKELPRGGKFKISPFDPNKLIIKYQNKDLVAVGSINWESIRIEGDLPYPNVSEKEREVIEKARKGFWINEYEHIRAEYAEISKIDPRYALLYNVERTFKDGRTFNEKSLALKIEDMSFHPTRVKNTRE